MSQFNKGDRVIVSQKVETGDLNGMGEGIEWLDAWVQGMDEFVGQEVTIADYIPGAGYIFEEDPFEFAFPVKALTALVAA